MRMHSGQPTPRISAGVGQGSVEIENHTRRHAVLLKALGKDVSHVAIKRESGRLAMRSETYRTAPVKE
ncbi:hypothetical protein J4E08_23315, partial [Sagittula sp. NFXS13]|uniref:hypothetical protein n=1 Tax=Sagittula sp. NFXS13 TaxID=2819095 RepID=UPI0032DE450A